MALTMLDKKAAASEHSEWPAEIKAEFERESHHYNGCVGTQLLSETNKVRVWIIRLQPGERVGFHRHVLDYFWTSVNGGRGRQHLMDGTTVEHTYAPGEYTLTVTVADNLHSQVTRSIEQTVVVS